ncbi:Dynamin- GTPase protein [Coelomomyces lativittatus]|nr:Dynamin- GTPase protein [Coelomomyces lativittatus]
MKYAHSTVLRLLTQYARDFNASVDGTHAHSNLLELSGGAKIYHIFDQIFGQTLEALDPATALSSEGAFFFIFFFLYFLFRIVSKK